MSHNISILLVEDHALFRQACTSLIESCNDFHVSGFAENAEQAVSVSAEIRPDIILMDIRLKSGTSLEAVQSISDSLAKTRIIMLTSYDSMSYVKKAFSHGARGYLTKNTNRVELIHTINMVYNGETYISKEIKDMHFSTMAGVGIPSQSKDLTGRELKIAILVSKGMKSREISDELCISPRTVETHRRNILKKLSFKNSAQLSSWIQENGYQ